MKTKIFSLNLNDKRDNIKMLFLVQVFVIAATMVYFSLSKWKMVDEQYHPIAGDRILMVLVILSGFVGVGSIYLFNEVVKLVEKEKDYELQRIKIEQMQEFNDLLRAQKHDFSNNLQVIWGMLSLGKAEKAEAYLKSYTNMLKIDEEELEEINHINNTYLYTLFLNKCYKCKDMEIDIHYSIDPNISLDRFNPIDLIRIFGNLIDNAIYAVKELEKQYREILIDIYCDDNNYFFSVCNKGSIIPEEIKDKIFKQGFTTKGNDGSGMGLYNVSQLTSKYRGKVCVESNEYSGTQFVVNIPKDNGN